MNRIPASDFLSLAESMSVGYRAPKVIHCGNSPSMVVEHTEKGYRAYCHTCHNSGWVPKHRSLAERIADAQARRVADGAAQVSPRMPKGEADPYKWPDRARVWLHKAGLSVSDIERLGFVYSEGMDRVVMPIYSHGKFSFWQARGFEAGQPKYLSPFGVDRKKLIPSYGTPGDTVVLTEDLLSAIKVGYVCEAWSLLGTELHRPMLLEIINRKLNVVVALDPDRAGRTAASQILPTLRAFGVPCCNVTRDLPSDPKLMSREALASLIKAQEFK